MYQALNTRYDEMVYNKCGESGLMLPAISIGLWQNFGDCADYDTMKDIILTAFDNGITHFDLANNYGPAPGAAEINFGRIFKENLKPYRDEIIIVQRPAMKCGRDLTAAGAEAESILLLLLIKVLKEWGLIMLIYFIIIV